MNDDTDTASDGPDGLDRARRRRRPSTAFERGARAVEQFVFSRRLIVLSVMAAITLGLGFALPKLEIASGFEKKIPVNHPYIRTFQHYRSSFSGADRLWIVVKADTGTILTAEGLERVAGIAAGLSQIALIDPASLRSVWSPDAVYIDPDEGKIRRVIPAGLKPGTLNDPALARIRRSIEKAHVLGDLVSPDLDAAMITADLLPQRGKAEPDLEALSRALEQIVRAPFEGDGYSVHIIGFSKQQGDVAAFARQAVPYFGVAFLLSFLMVYWYSWSFRLTALTVIASSVSFVWQLGLLALLDIELDPLALIVVFLVYAIGVSHGVQQINLLARLAAAGHSADEAARMSFRRLLVPGAMALATDLIGFGTLALIPIGMIQDVAIIAGLGILLKIVTTLLLLPLMASYLNFSDSFRLRMQNVRNRREVLFAWIGRLAEPRRAFLIVFMVGVVFVAALFGSRDRVIGVTGIGAAELGENSTYNTDARLIASEFDRGVDRLIVVAEMPKGQCARPDYMAVIDAFSQAMIGVEGVTGVRSLSREIRKLRKAATGFDALPDSEAGLRSAIDFVGTETGLVDANCSVVPIVLSVRDHADATIAPILERIEHFARHVSISAEHRVQILDKTANFCFTNQKSETAKPGGQQIENFCAQGNVYNFIQDFGSRMTRRIDARPPIDEIKHLCQSVETMPAFEALVARAQAYCNSLEFVRLRLASGNVGVIAAVNQELEAQEFRALAFVYLVILILVFATYRDWRAALVCTSPLTMATFIGYWFMTSLGIGLTLSTLPVLVLAVGVGVDYAFYIYNRLQHHLASGDDVVEAYQQAVVETGSAVTVTALTLAVGVAAWAFSPLKFQADMGLLLTFMFLANMLGTVTTLPALAVVIDKLFPRRHAIPVPLIRG